MNVSGRERNAANVGCWQILLQKSATCVYRKLDSAILVVKAAENGL
jgi:hypothetical protein